MDENRNDYRNDRNDNRNNQMNRNRNNRFRHGGHQGGGGQHGRGRVQRPLLTSAISAAGLALIALVILKKHQDYLALSQYLSLAATLFGFSALISYVAQRVRPKIIEWISDAFFIVGTVFSIYVSMKLGGFL